MDEKDPVEMISIEINGEGKQVPAGLNVLSLLEWLAIDPQRVAVEIDRKIVRKTKWAEVQVIARAQVEIVMFVGGG